MLRRLQHQLSKTRHNIDLRYLSHMSSKYVTLMLSLLAGLLLLGFAWSLNLTAFNWWAGGGPPVAHLEIYRMRGNLFFGIACAFLLAFLVTLWSLIRRQKRQSGSSD
jgi:hypothetical protein